MKCLGIYSDENLKYYKQVKILSNKWSRLSGISYRLKEQLNLSALKNFYHSCVYSACHIIVLSHLNHQILPQRVITWCLRQTGTILLLLLMKYYQSVIILLPELVASERNELSSYQQSCIGRLGDIQSVLKPLKKWKKNRLNFIFHDYFGTI